MWRFYAWCATSWGLICAELVVAGDRHIPARLVPAGWLLMFSYIAYRRGRLHLRIARRTAHPTMEEIEDGHKN